MKFLADPWPVISAAMKKAKTRVAITPYLNGTDAEKMLSLKSAGSVLIVDASDRNVAAGLTNPSVIERFMDKGVKCYSVANLHAKAYRADKTLFIGSMNTSENSRSNLVESCIEVQSLALIQSFEEWRASLVCIRITRSLIADLKKKYRAPKWVSFTRVKPARSLAWLTYVGAEVEDEANDSHAEEVAERNDIDSDELTWSSHKNATAFVKGARIGDEVFIIDHIDKRIYGPVRVFARAKKLNGWFVLVHEVGESNGITFRAGFKVLSAHYARLRKDGFSDRKLNSAAANALRMKLAQADNA